MTAADTLSPAQLTDPGTVLVMHALINGYKAAADVLQQTGELPTDPAHMMSNISIYLAKQVQPITTADGVQEKPCDAWSCVNGHIARPYGHEGKCSKCGGTGKLTAPTATTGPHCLACGCTDQAGDGLPVCGH